MAKKVQTVTTEGLKPIQIVNNDGQLKGLPKNPRFIRTKDFEDLKESIKECPEMTYIREVVVFPFNEHYIVIAGNMRFKAMEELGFKSIPCKVLHKSTPIKTIREIAIKDNVHSGKDDWDIIANDWDIEEVSSWNKETPISKDEEMTTLKNIKVTITDVNEDERDNIKEVLLKAGYAVK
jgi:hypothetical protein